MEENIESNISWFEEIWDVEVSQKAIELLDAPFFWDAYGTFVFGADEDNNSYREMSEAFKINPRCSFFEIIKRLNYANPIKFSDFYESNAQVILERTNTEGFFFVQIDYAIFEFAIGQLQFQGKIDKELKELVSIAVERQKMPIFLEYFDDNDRENQLAKIKKVAMKA